jgi:hypothetical protein
MCDYSLELYRSRPAEQDEQLTLERFSSGSMGFAAGRNCDTAVCIPADARLRLVGIADTVQRTLGIGPVEEVVMTRLEHGPHKDAVRFSNGRDVCLQSLNSGLTAIVLSLTAEFEDEGGESVAPATRELVDA